MKKNFDLFMSQLAETNATLDFYTDFSKIRENVQSIEIKLNTLNYLIGKEDLAAAVKELWDNDKRVLLGETAEYEPLCRDCYQKAIEEDKNSNG